LKEAFVHMMHSPDKTIKEQVGALRTRSDGPIPEGAPKTLLRKIYSLVEPLYLQCGDDIGIFCLFFLNIVEMKIGECLFMPQNTPHAYLSGDIVECMACSDNVVRGGLTPKYKDVEVLCEMLKYVGGDTPRIVPKEMGKGILLYTDPMLEEFQVTHCHVLKGDKYLNCFSTLGPCIAVVLNGTGSVTTSGERSPIKPGSVFFFSAGADVCLEAVEVLDVFAACCPPHYFKKGGLR